MTFVDRGYNLAITHGNGPQVGNLLLRQEQPIDKVPAMPLDVLVAQTEGSLGYILQQALLNQLRKRGVRRYVVTLVTQVLVEPSDPAFDNPSKPIGPFLSEAEAKQRAQQLGWTVREDAGRGWRRVVPSPRPRRVVQRATLRDTVREGHIVLAGGGGGIPIVKDSQTGQYVGVEAVIDKDLTSSVIARELEADLFVILTATDRVYTNFATPEQEGLGAVTLQEIERLREAGHFPPGSMGPKIDSVVEYLQAGGVRALITDPEHLADAMDGRAGTHFIGRI
jgi:carbamate kinase